jgi:hypothetical protein
LESDSKSENGDDNFDTTHALRTLDSEQPGHDALDWEILPTLFNRSADEPKDGDNDDGDNDIENSTSPRPAKRQRPASPRCEPNLRHIGTPPLLHNEDENGSREDLDGSDFDDSGDDDISSKRRKLSDSLGGQTTFNGHSGQSRLSPSPSSEDGEDGEGDRSGSISAEDNLASTARTSPAALDSAPLTEPQLGPEVIDANQEWEVRKVIGREDVDGVLHYLVEWSPTLEPEHSLGQAKELVVEFEAQLRA